MLNIKHNRVALIHVGLAILGVVGLQVGDHYLLLWYEKVGAAIALCLVIGLLVVDRNKIYHVFDQTSPKLETFFTKWYSQDGELIVYCNDLDWVKTTELSNALTLKATSRHLSLYLKDVGVKANQLKSIGADLYQISSSAVSPHRFSIIKSDGFERIICRNKYFDPAGVVFISTNSAREPYLIALAKDVLTSCIKVQ